LLSIVTATFIGTVVLNVPQPTTHSTGVFCEFRITAEKTIPGEGTAESVETRHKAQITKLIIDIILYLEKMNKFIFLQKITDKLCLLLGVAHRK
jgi:hypothetical protein